MSDCIFRIVNVRSLLQVLQIFLNCWFIVDSTQYRRYGDLPSFIVGKFHKPPSPRRDLAPYTHTDACQDCRHWQCKTTTEIEPRTTPYPKTNAWSKFHIMSDIHCALNPDGCRIIHCNRMAHILKSRRKQNTEHTIASDTKSPNSKHI